MSGKATAFRGCVLVVSIPPVTMRYQQFTTLLLIRQCQMRIAACTIYIYLELQGTMACDDLAQVLSFITLRTKENEMEKIRLILEPGRMGSSSVFII